MPERAEFKTLYAAYRRAWRDFVVEVESSQSRKAQSIPVQEAVVAVEQAEILYRKSRNELADYMISNNARTFSDTATLHGELKLSVGPVLPAA
jgi:hypothetical protein